jgi:hypothetical protein
MTVAASGRPSHVRPNTVKSWYPANATSPAASLALRRVGSLTRASPRWRPLAVHRQPAGRARRGAGFPDHQGCSQPLLLCRDRLAGDDVQEGLHSALAQRRHRDRRDARRHESGQRDIIKADNREVARHFKSGVGGSAQRSDSLSVGTCEYGARPRVGC